MFNKKRLIVFVVFVLFIFFMMTFASAPAETVKVNTRRVTFTDGYNSRDIATYTVEVGKGVEVPEAPKHDSVVFAGWYDYYDNTTKIEEFDEILNDTHVVALYGDDLNHNGILDSDEEHFLVRFIHGITNEVLKEESVLIGLNATAPKEPSADGYNFVGWDTDYTNVQSDLTVNSSFRRITTPTTNDSITYYRVTFVDGDTNQTIATYRVREGYSSSTPSAPTHEGRIFDHWQGTWTNVRSDQTVIAIYTDDKNNDGTSDNEPGQKLIVKFVNEGVVVKEEEVLKNMDATAPTETMTKESNDEFIYTFKEWDKDYTNVQTDLIVNAVYTSTKKEYQLTINYKYEDGTQAAESYVESIANGSTYSVDSPNVRVGYHADPANVSGTMPKEDLVLNVVYKANTNNTYLIKHYTEKLDGSFELKDTETKTNGVTGTTVTAEPNEYTGFTLNESVEGTVKVINITGEGTPELKLYYKRNINVLTIVYKYENNDFAATNVTHSLKYEEPYNYETPVVEGYDADKSVVSGTMGNAAKTEEVIYSAKSTNSYTVKHCKESLTGTYPEELCETEIKNDGVTNQNVTAVQNEYTGFTFDESIEGTIKTGRIIINEPLTLKLFYKRDSHTVTITYKYANNEHAAITVGPDSYKYEATYSYETPEVAGYSVNKTEVSGTMGTTDVTEEVIYTANTDVAYKIEHYTEKLEGGYKLEKTDNMTNGTTDQEITASATTFEGFTYDENNELNVKSGKVTADGNLVLKLYYNRNSIEYTVKVFYDDVENSSNTYSGKYGETIESSLFIEVPSGMKLDTTKTTDSITLPINSEINIYYVSTKVELQVTTTIDSPRNPAEYDDEITYTFTIKNIGDGSGNVTVKDLGLTSAYNPSSGDPLITVESSEVKVNGAIVNNISALDILSANGMTIDNMQPDQIVVVKLVVKVKANAGQTLTSKVETIIGDNVKDEEPNVISVEKTISLIQKTEIKVGANIIIVLDESGSMGYNNGKRVKKFIYAKEATNSFIDKVFTPTSNSNGSTVSVFTFGTKACGWFDDDCINDDYVLNPRSLGTATDYNSASTLKRQIGYLTNYPYDSGTPYFLGLKNAYEALYGSDGNSGLASQYPNNKNVVIFLSDGEPDETDNETLRNQYITALSDKDTIVYTIGYDVAINSSAYNTLVSVAGSTENTYLAGVNDLMEIFDQINTDIQDKKEPIQTEVGVAEIGNVIYADNTHPIKFIINKGAEYAETKTYNSIPAAKSAGYLIEDSDGYFHIEVSLFEPKDTIEFIYFKSVS